MWKRARTHTHTGTHTRTQAQTQKHTNCFYILSSLLWEICAICMYAPTHARARTRSHTLTPNTRAAGWACARTHTHNARAHTHIHTHTLIYLRFHLNKPEHAIDNHASLAAHRPVQGTHTIMSSSFPFGNMGVGQSLTSKRARGACKLTSRLRNSTHGRASSPPAYADGISETSVA